jgi:tetratricopeptide (TPR) repeat protein
VNDLEEAIRAANHVLEVNPELLAAIQLRAKANLGVHRLEDALTDSERLIELAPEDYQNRAIYASVLFDMGREEEAEAAHEFLREMGEASSDPAIRPRACIAPAVFAKDFQKDLERAESLFRGCVEKYPTDAFLINHVMGFLDGIDKPDAATDLVRSAVEAAPENLSLRSTLAGRLRASGNDEEAEKVLVEAAEAFGSAAAWNLLAAFYRRTNDSEKALAAIEKVIELTGGGGDELRFTQADVLIDLERYEEAESVVASWPRGTRRLRSRLSKRAFAAGPTTRERDTWRAWLRMSWATGSAPSPKCVRPCAPTSRDPMRRTCSRGSISIERTTPRR